MNLVRSTVEVIENAKEFSKVIEGNSIAFERFSQFFHWYYFPDLGLFAPSKFIGYQNTTISNYTGQGHGGETQNVLSKWFSKLDEDTSEYRLASKQLQLFAERVGKKLSAKVFNGSGGIYQLSGTINSSFYPDEINDTLFIEGYVSQVTINAIERNPEARKKCIEHYGTICNVCGFDFSVKYGTELGSGFIHVHHLRDISLIGKEYQIDAIKDLRPLCPNCHAMVHRTKPAMHPDKLKEIILKNT